MAVLVNNRKESKLEPIVCSVELHKMLTDLIQKDFGVKDMDHLVRVRYACGRDATENFSRYRYLMQTAKNNIDQMAFLLTNNLRGPTPSIRHPCASMNSGGIIRTLRL